MKKLSVLLLALALTASMAACGQKEAEVSSEASTESSVSESSTVEEAPETESSEEEVSDEVEADETEAPAEESAEEPTEAAATGEMPELDGYTMTEPSAGVYTYQGADGSTIMVNKAPGGAAAVGAFFTQKDDAAKETLGQMAAALPEGVEASYDFATIEGKETFFVQYEMEQSGIKVNSIAYMFVAGDDLVTVAGAGMNKDVSADLAKVIAAL